MLIFVNGQLPHDAKTVLAGFAETVDFSSSGIVYDAVDGHPDLFFAQAGDVLIVPPNLPGEYLRLLAEKGIKFKSGQSPVGFRYPQSAAYNAVITEQFFIHNLRITDPLLLEYAAVRKKIHVNQGYTRCNLLALGDTHFLTSDKGIYKTLHAMDLQVLFVEPAGIVLPGFSNGFFGGTSGVWKQTVFISGNLTHHPQGESIGKFIENAGFTVMELYDGPLFDGGSILFVG